MKRNLAKRHFLATALISCALIMVPAAANATEQCVVDTVHHDAIEEVSHQEYQYKKIIPAVQEVKHQEFRWKRRYSGPKEIKDWSYQNGSWVYTPGDWGAVPASLNPPGANSIAATGTVPGGTYGLPNDSNPSQDGRQAFRYRYQTPDGGTQWFPSQSGWATQSAFNNAALTDIGYSGNGWQVDDSTWVIDVDPTPDTTVYYVENGEPTTDLTDANWTTITPAPEGWTLVDERPVVTTLGEYAYDEDVYGDCPAPELAETGVNDNAWLFAGGGLLLLVAGVSLVTYRNRQKGATEHEQ